MKKRIRRNRKRVILLLFLLFIISSIIFFLDRVTKSIAKRISFCKFICINYSINKASAFGLFNSKPLLLIGGFVVAGLVLYLYFKTKDALTRLSFLLIFSGAIANLYDRLLFGYVIDFITFSFVEIPAFNLADSSIVLGLLIFLIQLLRNKAK